jgi:hydroxymethylpyrimidine pyrophosphatase-like HAD family hydrolase
MGEIKDTFGFGNAICANGAMHYDLMNEKILEQWLISVEDQLEVVNKLRVAIPPMSFAVEYRGEFHREIAYVPRWDVGFDNEGVEKIESKIIEPAYKMLARCSGYEFTSDQMLEIATREVGHIATITHSNSGEALLEISASNVSKGATLAKLAARLGLGPEDCVSFGDNPNDFSMLAWADRSWAISGGHADAPRYAKFLADPVEADGVAAIIEQLLELPTE